MYFADTTMSFQVLHAKLKSLYISITSKEYCTLQILHKLVPADFHLPSSPPCPYRLQHQHIPRNQVNISSDEWPISVNIFSNNSIAFITFRTIRLTIFGFWPIMILPINMQNLSLIYLEQSDQKYSGLVAALTCQYFPRVNITGDFRPVFIFFEQFTQQ